MVLSQIAPEEECRHDDLKRWSSRRGQGVAPPNKHSQDGVCGCPILLLLATTTKVGLIYLIVLVVFIDIFIKY